MTKIDLSIILACYNEGDTFENSVFEIVSTLKKTRYRWEIIFVEDKSTDETAAVVKKMVGTIPNSRAIFHKKNTGRGRTVADGIFASLGEICGYLDVDLEVSAKYIPKFVEKIDSGYDMVIGNRFYDKSSLVRFLASKLYAILVKIILGLPDFDTECGYK